MIANKCNNSKARQTTSIEKQQKAAQFEQKQQLTRFAKKEDESTSSLSTSNEFPRPKRKILLSMEVITEEKPRDMSESFNSENEKQINEYMNCFRGVNYNDSSISKKAFNERCVTIKESDSESVSDSRQQNKRNSEKHNIDLVMPKPEEGLSMKRNLDMDLYNSDNIVSNNTNRDQVNTTVPQTSPNESYNNQRFQKLEKESEDVLSFSSGTNLTQTSFDFGYSKLNSCECSHLQQSPLINKSSFPKLKNNNIHSKKHANKDLVIDSGVISKGILLSERIDIDANNHKDIDRKGNEVPAIESKGKSKDVCKLDKICKCGKNLKKTIRESLLEIPSFVVQPFNKEELLLAPRNYKSDSRGTLGSPYVIYF